MFKSTLLYYLRIWSAEKVADGTSCPCLSAAFKLSVLSYFIMWHDGQHRHVCFMNGADLSSCQSPANTVSWLINLDELPLRVTLLSLIIAVSSPFHPSSFTSLPVFDLHTLFLLPPVLPDLQSTSTPVDFSFYKQCQTVVKLWWCDDYR